MIICTDGHGLTGPINRQATPTTKLERSVPVTQTFIYNMTKGNNIRIALLVGHRHLITTIAGFLHDEWRSFPPWASISAIEDRMAEGLRLNGTTFTLVALSDENDFMGTAGIKRFELPGHHDKEHWLSEVFIPKRLRGQGIGSALISDCIGRSEDLGIQALYLYTPDRQKLYQRFGWHQIEQTFVNNESVSIMVRHTMHNL
ncbi:MAG: GNAT family N-acetyltransferase [Desulfobacterales bacterium]|nr:GNAT family N-acetyltransferase [Desulfobacterales bacterium]